MEVDQDEAYVSGNLPSGGFPSIGEGTAAPSSLTGPSSLSAGEEEREGARGGGKGGEMEKKKLPQMSSRRKKAYPNRHGGEGKEGSPGVAGAKHPPLPTPTTQLSQQINFIQLVSPVVTGGKRTLAEREDDISPMSEDEGCGPSLTDAGYVSLPPGHPSLEQPSSLPEEKGGGGGQRKGSIDVHMTAKPRGQELLQVERQIRERSDSPGVPPVGENVEVVTVADPSEQDVLRQEGTLKRVATSLSHVAKNPRLTEVPSFQHRPIKVPTIVSPALNTSRTGRSRSKKVIGSSPEVPMMISMDEGEPRSGGTSPSNQTSRVNFSSIEELSRSARQPDPDVETDHHRTPQLAQIMSMVRTARDSATFTERRSPQPLTSPTPNLKDKLSPRIRGARSTSPHSPHSPRTPQTPGSVDSGKAKGRVGEEGTEKGEGKRQNALLQVSEAHLAILPDEDGDTPLHLAIIHENVSLTQYLVKLIVGVYMNLDIANNMRQTPLHLAIITRQPHLVQLLVQAGASVNFPDRKGNTAIHLAAARRDVKILQLLSRATSPLPDYNAKNFAGLTAVHLATREASIDVLKFLFQVGANKNAMDACSGRTALHYAVEAENFILVNFLLENGCNVNAATFSGNTPLHIAAGRRLKEIVALLMAYGANPAIANGEGDFPTDLPASLLMQRAKMNAH